MAIESHAPCIPKRLDRYLDVGLKRAIFITSETEEQIFKEQELGLPKICNEDSVRLAVNDGDVASTSAPHGIEDSSTKTYQSNRDLPAKKRKINPGLLDGAVVQNGDTLDDLGVHPDLPLKDSENNMVETKNLGLSLSQHGTQSILTKEDERKERRKLSNRESAKRSRLRKQQENEMLREMAKKMKQEISELRDDLSWISEECQEVTEENNSLMVEVEETYGLDAISDLRARDPASANHEKGSSSGDSDSTADQNKEISTH
ncbi:Basic-leucine zipper transcription factor [Trema orientale]|uniref:Basic-leucine zipper transcription factor n=1 Tax=Trema orientale TaxID=63057 RepID=A0A2P5EH90_TREOI|nr:Basic-leucine zipper transcription factor [Trema orientale]